MIGLLKQRTREIAAKPWNLLARKVSEPVGDAPGEVEMEKKAKGFCDPDSKVACITVCAPKPGCNCEANAVRQALKDEIERQKLGMTVGDAKVGCAGSCKKGPFIGFPQKGFFYLSVHPADVPEIVSETLVNGRVLFPFLSINPDRSYRADVYYEKDTGLLAGIDDRVCMVQAAKYFLDFEEGLSCGKCVPCRIGIKRMQESIDHIVSGQGTDGDIEQLKVLCESMKVTPHCEFAASSSRPVLSALTYFGDEFKAHVQGQECSSGVCSALVEIQRKKAVRARLRKGKK